ncbi:MAG: HWE histidine kinase domain-containing protein, partial [Janthinobacterium lividum]
RRDGTRVWASGTMLPLLDEDGRPEGFLNVLRDRTNAQVEVERRALLMAEMNHRIKNTFATVQAVAVQTRRHTPDPAAFQAAFDARLQVLSRSHDVLIGAEWHDACLHVLIESALGAYDGEPDHIAVEGPAVLVTANLAVTVSLAFHELATNAVKYGALSVPQGRVAVTWTITPARHGGNEVSILWRERGGPPVQPPSRRGFGSQLLEKGLSPAGAVRLAFKPEGLECSISLSLGSDS